MECPNCGGVLEEDYVYNSPKGKIVEVYCTECNSSWDVLVKEER